VAFVPLLILESEKPKFLFAYSLLAFVLWNSLTTYWIVHATLFGVVMAVLINALLMAGTFTLFSWIKSRLGVKRGWWAFVCLWLSFEYLHLNWDLSWPWLTLGNGFANYPSTVQWYEFTGALGGSLWVLLANVLAYQAWQTRKFVKMSLWIALPIAASFLMTPDLSPADTVKVVVVQPNIDPYNEKFGGLTADEQLEKMLALAETKVDSTTDYLIGPETALVNSIWENQLDQSPAILRLQQFLQQYPQLHIIVGASTYKLFEEGEELSETARQFSGRERYYDAFNTAIQIDTSGIQLYHKSKLVPGVEMMPFSTVLKYFKSLSVNLGGVSGSLGSQEDRTVFSSAQAQVAPVICYESIYGEYMLDYVRNGTDLITIITNDGWWKDTPGYKQHLTYASLRAIETRRAIARSANTGTSAFIDAFGKISQPTAWWQEAAIAQELPVYKGVTFYATYGNYIGRLAGFVAAILLFYGIAKRIKPA
jgi:apolipoprotein N-acyltransferase